MSRSKLKISAGAVLLAALIYYLGDSAAIMAVLLPAAIHELGHIAALRLMGLRINGFRIELRGFCIEYAGFTGAMGHALAALCGPMTGLWYAWAASWLGNRLDSPWLCLSSGISLLLSAFNMLPALPLDGGRVLAHLSRAVLGDRRGAWLTEAMGLAIGAVMLSVGVWQMLHGEGIALAIAAVWLLLYQENERGIVKDREIL